MSPNTTEKNPAIESTLRAVGDRYIDACRELCAAYDVAIKLDESNLPVGNGYFRSVLKLTGDGLDMTSVLHIEAPLLVSTHAAMAPHGAPLDREDWCREFSNQLGGRLKNKLLPMGVALKVGLATLDPSATATVQGVPATEVQRCSFISGKGWLRAELSMHVSPDFTPTTQGEALLEGTYLMF